MKYQLIILQSCSACLALKYNEKTSFSGRFQYNLLIIQQGLTFYWTTLCDNNNDDVMQCADLEIRFSLVVLLEMHVVRERRLAICQFHLHNFRKVVCYYDRNGSCPSAKLCWKHDHCRVVLRG